jgi:6-phosphogluconolactonase
LPPHRRDNPEEHRPMPCAVYVCLQDEDKILTFALDAETGRLSRSAETPLPGGPSVLALSPDRRALYAGCRNAPTIASFRIDRSNGALSPQANVAPPHAPTFLAPDRTGKYLLAAYYQGGAVAVHPLAGGGAGAGAALAWGAPATGAHAIATDRSNRFAFVPHIARLNDNVLEPPRDNPGPNMILQFRFDPQTGALAENSPFRVEPAERVGPRHYCFHPSLDIVYFSNEQGCSVTAYRLDPAAGALSPLEIVPTLPADFTGRNTCSQIHLTPSGRHLYVANRGHNSIAGFVVDPASGRLTPAGHAATEAVPSAFALDPSGRYLFAAGTASGRLASYRIDERTGGLTPLAADPIGQRPAAVMTVDLGG